jgi:hypothetical protein
MKKSQPMLAAALSYVKRGWQIFPATRWKTGYSIEKRGIDTGTSWGRTSDPKIIRRYWKRIPNANIGLAMGAISGVFDIECDTIAGHQNLQQDGAASLAALEAQHGKLPATLMFVSPSGSVHRLFRHPGGDFRIEHSVSKLGEGIDVIGDNFMSVMPPSVKPGKGVYSWLNDLPIAAAPDWLLKMVRKAEYVPHNNTTDDEVSIQKLTAALALLPNDDLDWVKWNRIAMAIWHATGGSLEGYKLFAAWSSKSKKCGVEELPIDNWERITGCPPKDAAWRRAVRGPTVLFLAEQAVPGWQQRLVGDPEIKAMLYDFHKRMDAVTWTG